MEGAPLPGVEEAVSEGGDQATPASPFALLQRRSVSSWSDIEKLLTDAVPPLSASSEGCVLQAVENDERLRVSQRFSCMADALWHHCLLQSEMPAQLREYSALRCLQWASEALPEYHIWVVPSGSQVAAWVKAGSLQQQVLSAPATRDNAEGGKLEELVEEGAEEREVPAPSIVVLTLLLLWNRVDDTYRVAYMPPPDTNSMKLDTVALASAVQLDHDKATFVLHMQNVLVSHARSATANTTTAEQARSSSSSSTGQPLVHAHAIQRRFFLGPTRVTLAVSETHLYLGDLELSKSLVWLMEPTLLVTPFCTFALEDGDLFDAMRPYFETSAHRYLQFYLTPAVRVEGDFRAGLLEGVGSLHVAGVVEYIGDFVCGQPHGYGKMRLLCRNGIQLHTEWQRGVPRAMAVVADGKDAYYGQVRLVGHDGLVCVVQRHGLGSVSRGNQVLSTGHWRCDHMTGFFLLSEGYWGYVVDGAPHGVGVQFGHGSWFVGTFACGKRSGFGYETHHSSGFVFVGEWDDKAVVGRRYHVSDAAAETHIREHHQHLPLVALWRARQVQAAQWPESEAPEQQHWTSKEARRVRQVWIVEHPTRVLPELNSASIVQHFDAIAAASSPLEALQLVSKARVELSQLGLNEGEQAAAILQDSNVPDILLHVSRVLRCCEEGVVALWSSWEPWKELQAQVAKRGIAGVYPTGDAVVDAKPLLEGVLNAASHKRTFSSAARAIFEDEFLIPSRFEELAGLGEPRGPIFEMVRHRLQQSLLYALKFRMHASIIKSQRGWSSRDWPVALRVLLQHLNSRWRVGRPFSALTEALRLTQDLEFIASNQEEAVALLHRLNEHLFSRAVLLPATCESDRVHLVLTISPKWAYSFDTHSSPLLLRIEVIYSETCYVELDDAEEEAFELFRRVRSYFVEGRDVEWKTERRRVAADISIGKAPAEEWTLVAGSEGGAGGPAVGGGVQSFFPPSHAALVEEIRRNSAFGGMPGWGVMSVLLKNDDCLVEIRVLHVIRVAQHLFERHRLPLHLTPYLMVQTGPRSCIVEAVPDCISLSRLRRRWEETESGIVTMRQFFLFQFGDVRSDAFQTARRNFVESLAGYTLMAWLIDLRDRHDDNILLRSDGRLFHIDFECVFGALPGNSLVKEPVFKFTEEYLEMIGEDNFDQFVRSIAQGLVVLRPERERLANALQLTQEQRHSFEEKFCLPLETEDALVDFFSEQVRLNMGRMGSKLKDFFHGFGNRFKRSGPLLDK